MTPQQFLFTQLVTILTQNNPQASNDSINLLATELSGLWVNLILPNLSVNLITGTIIFNVPTGT